jgi:hypothetical protein
MTEAIKGGAKRDDFLIGKTKAARRPKKTSKKVKRRAKK